MLCEREYVVCVCACACVLCVGVLVYRPPFWPVTTGVACNVQTADPKSPTTRSVLSTLLSERGPSKAVADMRDSLLSKKEFVSVLKSVSVNDVSEDEADLLFELYDHDHDGYLTYEELVNGIGDYRDRISK